MTSRTDDRAAAIAELASVLDDEAVDVLLGGWERARGGEFSYLGHTVEYLSLRSLAVALRLLYVDRIYEFESSRERPTILDCGAWIGLTAIYFKDLFPQARVVSFEPDPGVYAVLRRNLRRNGLPDVETHQVALGSSRGQVAFAPDGDDGGSVAADGEASTIEVPAARLSDYVDGPVDLLKLNVEGAEWQIVHELGPRLRSIDRVLIEYHGFPDLPQTLHLILEELDRWGFRYVINDYDGRLNPACRTPLRLRDASRFFLLVCAVRLGA